VLKDMPTADGKKIEVSAWAVWKITDPKAFVQNLKTVEGGEAAVMVRLRSAIRDVITAHELEEVVRSTDRKLTYSFQDLLAQQGDPAAPETPAVAVAQPGVTGEVRLGREEIMKLVGKKVATQLKQEGGAVDRGIELVEVGISNIEFVPQVRLAAFERQKAFMQSIAAGYSNAGLQRKQEILNRTNAEVERLLGEGEQQSRILRGQADADNIAKTAAAIKETGDFYEFQRTLEMYQEALQGQTRLILTTDSDLLRLLKSPETTRESAPQPTAVSRE
jgi:membrane protease subunit HflC